MKILIVGTSDIARALADLCAKHDVKIVGRPKYNLTDKKACDRLVRDYNHYDCVVLTQGTRDDDLWNSFTVNTFFSLLTFGTKPKN